MAQYDMAVGYAALIDIDDPYCMEFHTSSSCRPCGDFPPCLDGEREKEGGQFMKRVFGLVEALFDILYLAAATIIGVILLLVAQDNLPRTMAGIMALVLVGGDAFHLLPRIRAILSGGDEQCKRALGRGKQITSITMTIG